MDVLNYLKNRAFSVYTYTLQYCRQCGHKFKVKVTQTLENGHAQLSQKTVHCLYTHIHYDIVGNESGVTL